MTKMIPLLALISALLTMGSADAQRPSRRNLPPFVPSVHVSVGYGFPDLDRNYLPDFYGMNRSGSSQSGVITGSVNYQFSRKMSIGVMVAHGAVSAPYYDYYSTAASPDFTGQLEAWSFMINLVRYIPISARVTPYIRTAIGVNSWQQKYTDVNGNKVAVTTPDLSDLARQFALGARFRLSPRAGLFVEAGYGRYILNSGLSIKL
ncbi:MAG TPA: outer membrane beta-barrel protein [Puia sp.]